MAASATNCSTRGAFDSLLEARVIIEDWRLDYNAQRPYTAHGDLTPTESPYAGTRPNNPKPQSDWPPNGSPSGGLCHRYRYSPGADRELDERSVRFARKTHIELNIVCRGALSGVVLI